jgi:hypothetical protein
MNQDTAPLSFPNASTGSKLLSVCVFARNDDYQGNFRYRLTTSLNFLARSVSAIGREADLEVVLADWNSEVPLSETLALSPEAAALVRFVRVPPEVAATVQKSGQVMYSTCAANVALRRASGEYLLLSDSDTLFPRHSLLSLFNLLEGRLGVPFDPRRATYVIGRYQLSRAQVKREPTVEEWERFLLLNGWDVIFDRGYTGLGTHGSGQLMHRDLWHECRGYNEQLRAGPWMDGDLTVRLTQRYPWLSLTSLGISVFHMDHESNALFTTNRYRMPPTLDANDDRWGLGGLELEEARAVPRAPSVLTGPGGDPSPRAPAPPVVWNISPEELAADMVGQHMRSQVQVVREHLLGFIQTIRTEPEGIRRRHLQMELEDLDAVEASLSYGVQELTALSVLVWFSLLRSPKTYLEFGIQRWYSAAQVAAVCPNAEIYGIDPWRNGPDRPVPTAYFLTYLLQTIHYRGYLRFVTGEAETAVERLEASSIFPLSVDLALLRGELFADGGGEQLCGLIPRMASGGALVFTSPSEETFQAGWGEALRRFPQYTYLHFHGTGTGAVLAARLEPVV